VCFLGLREIKTLASLRFFQKKQTNLMPPKIWVPGSFVASSSSAVVSSARTAAAAATQAKNHQTPPPVQAKSDTVTSSNESSNNNRHLSNQTRRREALSLYREILRTCKHFHWTDELRQPWNERLRQQARKEFDESRHETDPLVLARLLVTGRDCVQQVQNKFNQATQAAWKRIEDDNQRHKR
jgi:Complex 1 protein (LYR family)